jgi:hypothetical protein
VQQIKYLQIPLLLAVTFILIGACGDKYKILVLQWNAKKMNSVKFSAGTDIKRRSTVVILAT